MTFFVQPAGVSAPVEVYADLAFVDDYLASSNTKGAQKYRALITANDPDTRKRLIIDATRAIDSYAWDGVMGGDGGTTLQFPRAQIADDSATQLALVKKALGQFVSILILDPEAGSSVDAGSNVQSLGAGSGRLAFFRPTSAQDGNATVLPTMVDRLIGKYLASASAEMAGVGAPVAGGTSTCSIFTGSAGPRRTGPF